MLCESIGFVNWVCWYSDNTVVDDVVSGIVCVMATLWAKLRVN